MEAQRATEIQAALEGISLPATRSELIDYAYANDPGIVSELETLPEREFDRLDLVGQLLLPSPFVPEPAPASPQPESGELPGGPDYLTPFPSDTGMVRDDAPPTNPPQKAIDQASTTQKRQQAAQGT
jgi:hypothetical protein